MATNTQQIRQRQSQACRQSAFDAVERLKVVQQSEYRINAIACVQTERRTHAPIIYVVVIEYYSYVVTSVQLRT